MMMVDGKSMTDAFQFINATRMMHDVQDDEGGGFSEVVIHREHFLYLHESGFFVVMFSTVS
jgi:hypothetical protein